MATWNNPQTHKSLGNKSFTTLSNYCINSLSCLVKLSLEANWGFHGVYGNLKSRLTYRKKVPMFSYSVWLLGVLSWSLPFPPVLTSRPINHPRLFFLIVGPVLRARVLPWASVLFTWLWVILQGLRKPSARRVKASYEGSVFDVFYLFIF